MRGLLRPLAVPGFGRLLASYTVNELGDAIGIIALSLLVFAETGSAWATTALFAALKVVPALLAPLLVARIDQASLRTSLPLLYALEAAVFVALAGQVSSFSLPVVLGLALLDGVVALTGRGLSRGAVAGVLLPHDALRDGNALMNLAFGLAAVAGLALGGLIASAASLEAALLIDAGSFALIAILLATSSGLPGAVEGDDRQPFRRRVADGFAHVRRQPGLSWLISWQFVALVLFTLVLPIEVVYARETLETDSAGYGALLATWAAGILVGGVLHARQRDRAAFNVVLVSSAAIGAGYLGMGLVRDLAAACLFSFLGGLGNGAQWISVMTLIQEGTPIDLQARVTGLLESVAAAAPGVGFVLGGLLTSVFSPPTAYLTAGVGVLLLVALALRPRRRPAAPSGGA